MRDPGRPTAHRSTRPLGRLLAAACCLLAGAAPCPAEGGAASSEPSDLTQLSLEQLLEIEVPTVVAASRYAQKVTEAPSSVTIITAREIATFGYRTLADALRSVRGLYVSYDRNYSYLGVRGFSRPGDYNSRVLVLVDGHRTNDNVYSSALIGGEFPLDIDLIDHIEVVRGPGSSLYGTSAFFAVVNVVTRRPAEVDGTELVLGSASFGTYSGRATFGRQFENGPGILISASGLESDGQRLFYREFEDPATNHGVAVDSDYERAYSGFAKVAWRRFSMVAGHGSRKKGIPTGSFGTVFNNRRSRTVDEMTYVDLGLEAPLGSRAELAAHVYYDRYYYRGEYVYDYPPVTVNRDLTTGAWLGLDAKSVLTLHERDTLTVGADLQENLRQDQRAYDVSPRTDYIDSEQDHDNWAVYLQNELTLSKRLVVNTGVRYDHYATFGGTTNPRLALIYRASDKAALKAIYGTAFRAPSAYELYYGSPLFNQRTNPDLRPETIATWELAYDQYFDGGLRVGGSAFRYRIDDLITLTTDPSDGSLIYRNVDVAVSRGAGGEMEKRWRSGFVATASYSYQRTRDEGTHRVLSNSPEHLAKANLAIPLFGERLSGGVEAQYMGRRTTVQGGTAGGFTVANLTLTRRELAPGLSLSASAYNVLDRRYGDPGSEEHVQDVIEQDGRSYRIKLGYRF